MRLVAKLIWHELACRPRRLFKDEYLQAVISNLNHPLNVALRDNNVYAWVPKASMRLYYCADDNQVPYQNSLLARDTMQARGAKNVRAQDVKSNANHSQCVQPAVDSALAFFLMYRYIGFATNTRDNAVYWPLELYPNPNDGTLWVYALPGAGHFEVIGLDGRCYHTALMKEPGDYMLDLSTLVSVLR